MNLVENLPRAEHSDSASDLLSEDAYRALAAHGSDLISQHAAESGVFLYASPSFERILGFTPDELVRVSVYELAHPADQALVRREIANQFMRGLESQTVTFRIRHKNGQYRWLATNVKVLTDSLTGRKLGSVAVSRDITREQEATAELHRREERFRHLTSISSDWYWETDSNGKFTFLPDGDAPAFGIEPERLMGKSLRDTAARTAQSQLESCLLRMAAQEHFKDFVYESTDSSGRPMHISLTGAPFYDGEIFQGFRGIGRDVTEKIQAEEALAKLENENRTIVNNSPDILALVGDDGRYQRISLAIVDVLGYEPVEIIGSHFLQYVHPEDRSRAESVRAAAAGGELVECECRWLRKNGQIAYLQTVARLTQSGSLFLTSRDVTQRHIAEDELRRSQRTVATILETVGDAFFSVDRAWRVTYANTNAATSFGTAIEQMVGKVLWEAVPELIDSPSLALFRDAMASGKPTSFDFKSSVVGAWLEIRVVPHEEGLSVSFHDVTAERDAEVSLRESERRLREVILSTPAGYLHASAAGNIDDVNPSLCVMTGFTREELVGQSLDRIFSSCPWHGALLQPFGPTTAQGLEARVYRRDGQELPVLFSGHIFRDELGQALSFSAFITDITTRKEAEQRLEHLATHDTLTGLPNRAFLNARVESLLASTEQSEDLAVMFIDLDRFKRVNDSFGHEVGDELLREVARRFRMNLRPEDVIGRLGGDEFLVVARCKVGRKSAKAIAEKLLASLVEPIPVSHHRFHVSASVGVSLLSEGGKTRELLFQNADTAMYRAKAAKANGFAFFSPKMSLMVKSRLTLEDALRGALDRQEFHLCYQPRFDLRSGELRGMEALIRWRHPAFGLVSPAEFIPIAEDVGLMDSIGQWVVETALTDISYLLEGGGNKICISINLSAQQLNSDLLLKYIKAALEKTKVSPCCVEFELTESAMVENIEHSTALLRELKALGARLSLDDFGTGYSGLTYLKRLPVNIIKLDRSFIESDDGDLKTKEFVKAFADMAHALGLHVVAEGIETEEQLALVRASGCDEVQGFLLGKPLPLNEFKEQFM